MLLFWCLWLAFLFPSGIFLIDAFHELYMWQGWWPRDQEENQMQATTTGSAETRFSNDRRLAMETTKSYAQGMEEGLWVDYREVKLRERSQHASDVIGSYKLGQN